MGKVLSSIKKLKSNDADPEQQGRFFQSLAEDPNMRWQDPTHKDTMVEATRAAQRLSVYQQPPDDSVEKQKYLQDQQKVDDALNTIKKNQKGNIDNIKLAVEKAIGTTPGGPSSATETKSNSNHINQWTYDASNEKKREDCNWDDDNDNDNHLYAASTQKSHISSNTAGSGSSSQPHNSLPSAQPDFHPQYTASHKKSESWDDDTDEEPQMKHIPPQKEDTHRKKSISSSYADDKNQTLAIEQSHSREVIPRSVVAYTAKGKQVHDIRVYNTDEHSSESVTSSDSSDTADAPQTSNIFDSFNGTTSATMAQSTPQVNNTFNVASIQNKTAPMTQNTLQQTNVNINMFNAAPKANKRNNPQMEEKSQIIQNDTAPMKQNIDTELLQWDDAGEEEEEVVHKSTNQAEMNMDIERRSVSSSYAADVEEEEEDIKDMKEDIKEEEEEMKEAQPQYRLIAPVSDASDGANDITISIPRRQWSVDNQHNTLEIASPKLTPKLVKKQSNNLEAPSSYSAYGGMRIQVDVLCSFHDAPWILNKDKKQSQNVNHLKIKHSDRIKNVKEYHRNRRVSLTNGHNFLWFTNAVQSSQYSAEKESELTRKSLDKVLNLLPIPFRDKIWEICNEENDTFMFQEDFAEFANALLVATGQYDLGDEDELDFEIRDMTEVFNAVVDINKIFRDKRYVSKWSKTARCLSTKGAEKVVMRARNLRNRADLCATDDVSIAFFTGFTKRALQHAIAWCTRILWKLLTDIWWDEDDEEDMALPQSLSKYQNTSPRRKRSRRNTTRMSAPKREAMKQAMSMEVLFPDLLFDESEDEEFDPTFTQYLNIMDD